MEQNGGKVRVVYKNFLVHPDRVTDAHLAACAAGKQGKFLEFKKAFWAKGYGEYKKTGDPKALGRDAVQKIAGEAGIDTGKFATDMGSDECKNRLAADIAELSKFGVSGTPSFFINGKFTMFSSVGGIQKMIDAEAAEVEKSGVSAADYYQKVVIEKGSKKFVSKADRGG